MLAQISPDLAVAGLAIIVTLLMAAIGGLWKLATQLATLAQSVTGLIDRFVETNRRISRLERHSDEHDEWHMARISRGADKT